MERESFEDEGIADYLNQHFVSIKVDREERPDIDHLYMEVCVATTGQGGWPLTLVLTPEGKPFFAGTYFPKEKKYGRMGLSDILMRVVEVWTLDRMRAEGIGEQLVSAITESMSQKGHADATGLDQDFFDALFKSFRNDFDKEYGGFGDAPKFPSPHGLLYLLRYYEISGNDFALEMATTTLEKMHRGGIYDHLGGGFSRYSTDRKWLVPHFEKMLYDNALLIHAYLDAYQITKDPVWKTIAEDIMTYVSRDMVCDEGVFYSAEDADSEGQEGKFYIFSKEEIVALLGEHQGEEFARFFGVTQEGNFEGENILHLQSVSRDDWRKWVLQEGDHAQRMSDLKKKLFHYRNGRIRPSRDDKILLGWNALLISAFAKAARVLQETNYLQVASDAVDFIDSHLQDATGRYYTRFADGEVKHLAYLDDYAYLAWAKLELYETSLELRYLEEAVDLVYKGKALFDDEAGGGFFLSGVDGEKLFTRTKTWYDGALPSGNSVLSYVLAKLSLLTGNVELLELRDRQVQSGFQQASRHPSGFAFFAMGLQLLYYPTKEIVLSSLSKDAHDLKDWIRMIHERFLPQHTLLVKTGDRTDRIDRLAPFTKGQNPINGSLTAFVCENFACHTPVTTWEDLEHLL